MSHERRVLLAALLVGAPSTVAALVLLWTGDVPGWLRLVLTVVLVVGMVWLARAVRTRVTLPLRTVANLLEALREGDYSVRARLSHHDDALGEVMAEVNALGDVLQRQRFHAVDAAALLERVIEEIDVAVFTFDEDRHLQLVNRAGQRMMARDVEALLGQSAAELGLDDCLSGAPQRTFERGFPGQRGRWQSRRSAFREGGVPRVLLVLTDLSQALRDEERQAWQRLIRVLGHELNNSLAPIKSTATTLASLLRRDRLPEDWQVDTEQGLDMIAARAESLRRFVAAYGRLARLPAPTRRPTPVAPLVRRVVALEQRLTVALVEAVDDASIAVAIDGDQIEQALINLVKNAADAVLGARDDATEGVEVRWWTDPQTLRIEVRDDGPGIANPSNLFVPFFTTKPGGTGIGLELSRQIAEAHGGALRLVNRADGPGCTATLELPVDDGRRSTP